MYSLSVQLDAMLAGSADGQTLERNDFDSLVANAREKTSEAGERLSAGELRTLLRGARHVADVHFAVGQLQITVADLRAAYEELRADGTISSGDLQLLVIAAAAPRSADEAGASVSAEELQFIDSIRPDLDAGARSALQSELAPALYQALDEPARLAGVSLRGIARGPLAPKGPRHPRAADRAYSLWPKDTLEVRFDSASMRISAANFRLGRTDPPAFFWGLDGAERAAAQENDAAAWAQITDLAPCRYLHLSAMMFPSGHRGNDAFEYARLNHYVIEVTLQPDTLDAQTLRMQDIRNGPTGRSHNGTHRSLGNEEYVTVQDISIPVDTLRGGDRIRISMWPVGTSAEGNKPERILYLRLPSDWQPA